MAIEVVSGSWGQGANWNGNFTVTLGKAALAGQTIVSFHLTTGGINATSGYTIACSERVNEGGSPSEILSIQYKVATGGETTVVVDGIDATNGKACACIIDGDIDFATSVCAVDYQASTTGIAPSVDCPSDGSLLIAAFFFGNTWSTVNQSRGTFEYQGHITFFSDPVDTGPTGTTTDTNNWSQAGTLSVVFAAPASGGVTGSGSVNVVGPTASGSGDQTLSAITGSGSVAVSGPTADGSGTVAIDGASSATIDAVTALGSGVPTVSGSGSASALQVDSVGFGAVSVVGSGAVGVAGPACSGTGAVTISGDGSTDLVIPTATGSGTVSGQVYGAGEATVNGPAATGSGTVNIAGQGSADVSTVGSAGTANVVFVGTGAAQCQPVQATGSGGLSYSTSVEVTTSTVGASGSGTIAIDGQGLAEIVPPTASGTDGSERAPVRTTLTITHYLPNTLALSHHTPSKLLVTWNEF